MICRAEGQAEVARLPGLGGAEVGRASPGLSGFLSLLRSRDTAGRTEAFIISKVTGFSGKASQAKNEQLPRARPDETQAILLIYFFFFFFFFGGLSSLLQDRKRVGQIVICVQGLR